VQAPENKKPENKKYGEGPGAARRLGGECRPDALSRRYIDARR
jgi:hypothetical protein